jgi:hypothetical protein
MNLEANNPLHATHQHGKGAQETLLLLRPEPPADGICLHAPSQPAPIRTQDGREFFLSAKGTV